MNPCRYRYLGQKQALVTTPVVASDPLSFAGQVGGGDNPKVASFDFLGTGHSCLITFFFKYLPQLVDEGEGSYI